MFVLCIFFGSVFLCGSGGLCQSVTCIQVLCQAVLRNVQSIYHERSICLVFLAFPDRSMSCAASSAVPPFCIKKWNSLNLSYLFMWSFIASVLISSGHSYIL